MPQDGTRYETNMEVVSKEKDSFEVKLLNPSANIVNKINWWFSNKIDFIENTKTNKNNSPSEQSV